MPKNPFKSIIAFLKRNRKRLILLTLMSLVLHGTLFFMAYMANPEKTVYDFSKRFGLGINTFLFIVEAVVTYYLLIFHVILPLMHKVRIWRALAVFFVMFALKLALSYWWLFSAPQDPQNMQERLSTTAIPDDSVSWFLLWHAMFSLCDLVACFSVALMAEWIRKSKQQIILEKQKAEAELSALKHQINPHFLFNSLSFIYSKIMKSDEKTAESVLILADIMRYALAKREDVHGRVNIMEEVEHLKNVIEINQRRHDHRLNICFDEDLTNPSASIVPLVLITLVENAFKHGNLHDQSHPILIKLHTNDRELSFYIKNKKGNGIKELSNGIGLQNIRRQLDLIYGSHYNFVLEDEPSAFTVQLKIPLNS
ncbi:Histidine kinase [Parapedobacter composti]|uniref:Histidine kinase n=1 Tax=Parapedobacter composti TaxID=623281 RepID=A0A1I1MM17_9SPHI|nr:histidine kinase [Parapedobacter composti]SFC83673.1 Histidine kinase [Parapedobacter composti]